MYEEWSSVSTVKWQQLTSVTFLSFRSRKASFTCVHTEQRALKFKLLIDNKTTKHDFHSYYRFYNKRSYWKTNSAFLRWFLSELLWSNLTENSKYVKCFIWFVAKIVPYLSLLWALGIPCPLSVLLSQAAPQWLHVLSEDKFSCYQSCLCAITALSIFILPSVLAKWWVWHFNWYGNCFFTFDVFH